MKRLLVVMILLCAVPALADESINLKNSDGTITKWGASGDSGKTTTGGYSRAYIATATTTQVKSGAGFLHCITVNTTAAGAISVIDNTSGSTVNIASLKASVAEGSYCYDVPFTTGLRIITAAASDITVSYY